MLPLGICCSELCSSGSRHQIISREVGAFQIRVARRRTDSFSPEFFIRHARCSVLLSRVLRKALAFLRFARWPRGFGAEKIQYDVQTAASKPKVAFSYLSVVSHSFSVEQPVQFQLVQPKGYRVPQKDHKTFKQSTNYRDCTIRKWTVAHENPTS